LKHDFDEKNKNLKKTRKELPKYGDHAV